ncbi:DUF2589 domain-containing protein [Luteibacter yeojuensis]|uniref:DUF2589 domain-containing protein n=1 Tax=Luteibacter yeojuensis TaxID=345309 RepID=A0A0F3KY05_9GAMM|nr:DUF2589 domain-containing protein [Luteibacter yeojuensis]KJV36088.1 hypothetical protein VI08_06305 [Luteibacter yeojuensis]
MTISDQFRGLPMGDLVGAPLMAACEAQVRLAQSTADFINKVGFEHDANGVATDKSRTSDFKFMRPVQQDDGTWKEEQVSMSVPLLAIVKVPTLAVEDVNITFDMEVKTSTNDKNAVDSKTDFSASWGGFGAKVAVSGSVSTHKENTRTSDNSAKYHVNVQARDTGMPEGLARVMDILQTAVVPKTTAASTPAPTPTP